MSLLLQEMKKGKKKHRWPFAQQCLEKCDASISIMWVLKRIQWQDSDWGHLCLKGQYLENVLDHIQCFSTWECLKTWVPQNTFFLTKKKGLGHPYRHPYFETCLLEQLDVWLKKHMLFFGLVLSNVSVFTWASSLCFCC